MRRVGWKVMMSVMGAAGVVMLALRMATMADAHLGDGSAPGLIHACVKNNNGATRIVGPTGSCKDKETAVHWSIQGPAGVLGSFDDLAGLPCTDPDGNPGSITVLFWGQAAMPACATGRYIDLGATVYDTQTALQWEKKLAGGGCVHCVDDTYNWCQATGIDAPNCDVAAPSWIARVNDQVFAGHTDWRVPTVFELQTIVDCGSGAPCIDPIFGPTASAFYWSASETGPHVAFFVSFASGNVFFGGKPESFRVRAVRGGP